MMRIAFGLLVYLGLCLGEFAHFLSALHLKRCSHSSPPSPSRLASIIMIYECTKLHRLMFFPVSSLPATIAAQFIEISHESVHVGDDVTLKCSLADNEHDTRDVTNYVWYLNSESHEAKKFYWFFPLCFFPSSSPIRKPAPRFVSFFCLSLPFLLCCFAFDCLPFFLPNQRRCRSR